MVEEFYRLKRLPPYLFAEVNAMKQQARARGEDIIDFGMGNPDSPTPKHIVDKLCEAVQNGRTHRYSTSRGIPGLRRAIAGYYKRRFDVDIDPETEAVVTIGSKEGLVNLAQAITAPGDVVLVPNPTYPIHQYAFIIAGAAVRHIPMTDEHDFLQELERAVAHSVPAPIAVVLNFPSNPTARTADLAFYAEVVDFCRQHDLFIISDVAYGEIYFEGEPPPSVLQVPGAREIAIEIQSLSKTYSMPGWRMGYAVGCQRLVEALAHVKSYVDYGAFTPIQVAAAAALNGPQDCVEEIRQLYKERRDVLVEGLASAGWEVPSPPATMFAWVPLPPQFREMGSMAFSKLLLQEAKVAVSPGIGFGEYGEGYLRVALVENPQRIRQAVRNIKQFLSRHGSNEAGAEAKGKKEGVAVTATVKLAVAGLGTVGGGLLRLIEQNGPLIRGRAGRAVEVVAVSARTRNKDRGFDVTRYQWFDDPVEMARQVDADIFVELIGGSDGPALAACEAALDAGRHLVTANKALLAEHGSALADRADRAGVALNYEAAVAGGIPIVKALREGLSGNRIERVVGILNGTCNYILTTMRATGRAFEDVLEEAQGMGYAEADPSFDIDGVDAAHKLALLTSLAYGTRVDFQSVHVEGIRHISPLDIGFAEELGFRIKLLAIVRETAHGIEQRVHPCMVPRDSALSKVEGVYNAVMVDGDFSADTVYEGRGAGEGPTASAVAADIVDIARGQLRPAFGVPSADLEPPRPAPMDRHFGPYYVRLMVRDEPGVIADISAALRDEAVSLEAMIQRARSEDEAVPVVLTTHETEEAGMKRAVDRIAGLDTVVEVPCVIRIEPF